ncbi:MAG: hypothetical protein HY247_03135 [archaeon]|nr:MAG: hypothetical protein HY247_03135 [archaeon]
MAALSLDSLISLVINYLYTYVVPYLAIIAILGLLLWAGLSASSSRRFRTARAAMMGEVRLNIQLSKSIVEYTEKQKVGSPYAIPIPRFYTTAYDNLRNQGMLFRLKPELSQDLAEIYMAIDRVHAACDREEDLAIGPAATSPMAADLRAEALSFIQSSVNTFVKPRLDRIDGLYRKR